MRNLLCCLLLLGFACAPRGPQNAAPATDPDCGPPILVAPKRVNSASDDFTASDVSVDGTCLSVTVSASGCSSDDWKLMLVTDGRVGESYPTQTSATLIFDDAVPEGGMTCQAFLSRTFRFDLTPYLGQGTRPTQLALVGADTVIGVE